MAPRFRQMPTSSYQAITLIPLIRKMIIQILVRRRWWSLITNKERTMRDGFCFSTRVLTRYFFAPKVWFGFPKCNVGVAIAVGVAVRSEWKVLLSVLNWKAKRQDCASCELCVRPNLNPGWHQPPSGNHLLTKLYQSCSMWRQQGRMIAAHHVQHLASLSPELGGCHHQLPHDAIPCNSSKRYHVLSPSPPDNHLTIFGFESGQSLDECGLNF